MQKKPNNSNFLDKELEQLLLHLFYLLLLEKVGYIFFSVSTFSTVLKTHCCVVMETRKRRPN